MAARTSLQRVLIIGHCQHDMVMDSYRRALAPHYHVVVVDPYSVFGDLEKRLLGPQWGAEINRAVATFSRLALGSQTALAEKRLLRAASEHQPDLVLTDCVETLHPRVIRELKRRCPSARLLGRFSDAISNLDRGYVFLSEYDRIFFKDRYLVEKLRKKLARSDIHYLPQAMDRHLHRPVALSDDDRARFGCDIALYGNGYIFRAECLRALQGRDVKVWGSGLPRWADHPTEPMFTRRYVTGDEKCKAMLAAKIALNPNHYAEIAGTNKRTFELAGIGAFQLTDTPALREAFTADEVAEYDSAEELLARLDHYLARPEERAAMARRATARAHAEHTYEHRWVAMLATLGLRPPTSFPVQPEHLRVHAE